MSNAELTSTITIRIPNDLADRIRELADRDVRSTNGEITYLLRLAVDVLDKKQQP